MNDQPKVAQSDTSAYSVMAESGCLLSKYHVLPAHPIKSGPKADRSASAGIAVSSTPFPLHDPSIPTKYRQSRRQNAFSSGGSDLLPLSTLDPLPPRPGGGRPLLRNRFGGTSRQAPWWTPGSRPNLHQPLLTPRSGSQVGNEVW